MGWNALAPTKSTQGGTRIRRRSFGEPIQRLGLWPRLSERELVFEPSQVVCVGSDWDFKANLSRPTKKNQAPNHQLEVSSTFEQQDAALQRVLIWAQTGHLSAESFGISGGRRRRVGCFFEGVLGAGEA